jgi:hypothetical protein
MEALVMKNNIKIGLITISVLFLLIILHSLIAVVSITLISTGLACYNWDRKSKSINIRKFALSRNIHLITAGALLFLPALVTTGESSLDITGFLWVVAYSFSLTAAPVMIWRHFASRRYQMERIKFFCKKKSVVTPSCPVFFEQRDTVYQHKSFSYRPSHNQPNTDQKQLHMAV